MLKKTLAATAALLAVLTLGACGASESEVEEGGGTYVENPEGRRSTALSGVVVDLPDGRTVVCVVTSSGTRGGLDCDWENAK